MKAQGSDGQRGTSSDTYSDDETNQRVQDALRRALNTPAHHKPDPRTTKAKERPATKGRVHRAKSRS